MRSASTSPVVQRLLAVKGLLLRRRRRPHTRPVDQQGRLACSGVTLPALRMLPWSTTDGIELLAGIQMRFSRGVRSTSLRRIEQTRQTSMYAELSSQRNISSSSATVGVGVSKHTRPVRCTGISRPELFLWDRQEECCMDVHARIAFSLHIRAPLACPCSDHIRKPNVKARTHIPLHLRAPDVNTTHAGLLVPMHTPMWPRALPCSMTCATCTVEKRPTRKPNLHAPPATAIILLGRLLRASLAHVHRDE